MLIEVITVGDRVFGWPFLPILNLMITQIIVMLITRITAIATSPISDARKRMPNEVYVGGLLVGICTEVLVTVVVTIAVTTDVVLVDVLTVLHSSMKS